MAANFAHQLPESLPTLFTRRHFIPLAVIFLNLDAFVKSLNF
jgi:hypothetical protein